MKILIVGSQGEYAIERHFNKYFNLRREVNSEIFPAQDMFLAFYTRSMFNKMTFRLGLKEIYREINRKLLIKIAEQKPQFVFVFKGMEIFPSTLEAIRSQKILLVNYNPDNPFFFSGRGSGNKNVTDSIRLFDHHYTYDRTVLEKFKSLGLSCSLLPFGFEIKEEIVSRASNLNEINRVCFVGNPDRYRADFIKSLANKGIVIDLYGLKWSSFLKHKNIKIYPPVYNDEFWLTLRKYRVQLNIMRPHNPETHNMRSFEIPAIGGIQLAPETLDHKSYFNIGSEIFIYKSAEDCVDKINGISALTMEEANIIRLNAIKRSIQGMYSYRDRVDQAISALAEFYH